MVKFLNPAAGLRGCFFIVFDVKSLFALPSGVLAISLLLPARPEPFRVAAVTCNSQLCRPLHNVYHNLFLGGTATINRALLTTIFTWLVRHGMAMKRKEEDEEGTDDSFLSSAVIKPEMP
jgi:hypothetical protein